MSFIRNTDLSFRHQRRKIFLQIMRQVLIYLAEIVAAGLLAFALVYGLGLRVSMSGDSMASTFEDGETLFVNRFVYSIMIPKSGDVIVFRTSENEKSPYYIKRIVGTPGDTVQIRDGLIYVNDVLFDTGDTEAILEPGVAEEKLTIEEGEYFVIGDNRNDSQDSRYANFGNVKEEYIIGKAWFYYNALNDLGFVR